MSSVGAGMIRPEMEAACVEGELGYIFESQRNVMSKAKEIWKLSVSEKLYGIQVLSLLISDLRPLSIHYHYRKSCLPRFPTRRLSS